MRNIVILGFAAMVASTPALGADPQNWAAASGLHPGGTFSGDVSYLMFDPENVDVGMAQRLNAGIAGAYSRPLSANSSFQIDAAFDGALQVEDDDDQTLHEGTLAGHLDWRDPSSKLFGVFGGGGYSQDNGDNGGPASFYFVGLEGQAYFNRWTLGGQAGYLNGNDNYLETINNAWFGRAVASYYPSDNTKLSAEISFVHGDRPNNDPDSGGIVNAPGWGVRAEHTFAGHGFSLFASYNSYDFQTTEESDAPWVNEFKVGFVKRFGSTSIFDNDRNAVALDLPPVSRWISISTNEIE